MLCYYRIYYKCYPFNVMVLSNILQTLSLQCYVIVEYTIKVIPSMFGYYRIYYKRYPFNVMLLSNILQTLSLQCYVIVEYTLQTLSLQCHVIIEYTTNVILSMLCYCRVSYKSYPFNVMLLSKLL